MLPADLVSIARGRSELAGGLIFFAALLGGAIGLWTLLRVVSALFYGKEIIERPGRILAGFVLGAAPLIYQVILALSMDGEIPWGIFTATVVLPLLASAHILYLSRPMLCASFQRSEA